MPVQTSRILQSAISSASSSARWIALTVDSILTTTPFFSPRDGELPMPITSKPPSGFISATMASDLRRADVESHDQILAFLSSTQCHWSGISVSSGFSGVPFQLRACARQIHCCSAGPRARAAAAAVPRCAGTRIRNPQDCPSRFSRPSCSTIPSSRCSSPCTSRRKRDLHHFACRWARSSSIELDVASHDFCEPCPPGPANTGNVRADRGFEHLAVRVDQRDRTPARQRLVLLHRHLQAHLAIAAAH